MKSIVLTRHGDLESLEPADSPEPRAGQNEVLVRVKACALNHLDVWVRKGLPGIQFRLPLILGSDISGVVEDAGPLVTGIRRGDKVILSPGISCMQCHECLSGNDNLCRSYSIFGYSRNGGYAEYLTAPAANVVRKPASLSFEEAASLPLVLLTAWHMLAGRAELRPGETILIHAAGSGVGSIAIQIAKLFGARVITTASTDEKLDRARELGADDTINYSRKDFLHEVKRLTDSRGVDVVFEHTGEATWGRSIRSLVRGGRLVTCGATSGYHGNLDIRYLFSRQISLLGSYMGPKHELLDAMKMVEAGRVKPVIDKVLPLQHAREAHKLVEDRAMFGKVVLAV